jgi:hypothetical protein
MEVGGKTVHHYLTPLLPPVLAPLRKSNFLSVATRRPIYNALDESPDFKIYYHPFIYSESQEPRHATADFFHAGERMLPESGIQTSIWINYSAVPTKPTFAGEVCKIASEISLSQRTCKTGNELIKYLDDELRQRTRKTYEQVIQEIMPAEARIANQWTFDIPCGEHMAQIYMASLFGLQKQHGYQTKGFFEQLKETGIMPFKTITDNVGLNELEKALKN